MAIVTDLVAALVEYTAGKAGSVKTLHAAQPQADCFSSATAWAAWQLGKQ